MSTPHLSRVLVVDLEATCWEGESPPEGQQQDIIEVGFCILDADEGTISPPSSYLVRPTRSEVSPFCTQLTTITPRMVMRSGLDFAHICELLEVKLGSRNKAWASFGNTDAVHFRKQCAEMGVGYPFEEAYFDIARLFTLMQGGYDKSPGLAAALDTVGISWEGQAHRAGPDAYNAARLLLFLLKGETTLSRDAASPL